MTCYLVKGKMWSGETMSELVGIEEEIKVKTTYDYQKENDLAIDKMNELFPDIEEPRLFREINPKKTCFAYDH